MNVQTTKTPQPARMVGKAELIIACMVVNKIMERLDALEQQRQKAWFKKTKEKLSRDISTCAKPLDDALFEIVKLVRRHGKEDDKKARAA